MTDDVTRAEIAMDDYLEERERKVEDTLTATVVIEWSLLTEEEQDAILEGPGGVDGWERRLREDLREDAEAEVDDAEAEEAPCCRDYHCPCGGY